MQRNNRLLIARHKLRKAVHILFFLLCCCPLTAFFGCGVVSVIKAPFEMVGFTQGMMGQFKERETSFFEDAASLERWIRLPPK